MRSRSLLVSAAVMGSLLVVPATALAGGSVGSSLLYSSTDTNRAGQAEAFRNVASVSGPVDSLSVYLASGNTASKVELGLYREASGRPSSLLGRCVIAAPKAGRVEHVRDDGAERHARAAPTGRRCCSPGAALGTLRFRSKGSSGSEAVGSSSTRLTQAPATWSTGPSWNGSGPASLYALQADSADTNTAFVPAPSPTPTATPSPPTAAPTETAQRRRRPRPRRRRRHPRRRRSRSRRRRRLRPPTPTPPPSGRTGCFSDPSACGYPDADNTGPVGGVAGGAGCGVAGRGGVGRGHQDVADHR